MPDPTALWKNQLTPTLHPREMVPISLVHRQAIIEALKQLDGLKRTLHKLLQT